jgi:CelD/BcsL family acetyltransferase involved in cellulose biosynthesis
MLLAYPAANRHPHFGLPRPGQPAPAAEMTLPSRAAPIETDRARAASRTGADRLVPTVFTDLATIEPIWRELESRAVTTPYQRFDWLAAIRSSGLDAESRLAMVVFSCPRRGLPVALLPLAVTRKAGLAVGAMLGAGQSNADFLLHDPHAGADLDAATLRRGLGAIRARGIPLDLVRFSSQPAEVDGIANPLLALPHRPSANNLYAADLHGKVTPFIDHHMMHKRRSNIRRGARRLEELLGPVRLQRAETAEELRLVHETFLDQRAARFAVMGIDNVFASDAFVAFFSGLAAKEFGKARPALCFHALYAGETIVATCCGAFAGSHYSQYINSTAEGPAARFSLMSILVAELIDELIGEGITSFDMGLGDFDYKRDWTEAVPVFDTVVPVTLAGSLALPVMDISRSGKRFIKQNPALWKLARGVRLGLYRARRLGRD